jgi:hypothetical protein
VPAATDKHATIEELLEAVFSVGSEFGVMRHSTLAGGVGAEAEEESTVLGTVTK